MANTKKGRDVFLTGFPGFIGRRIVQKHLETHPEDRFTLLIEERLRERAEGYVREIEDKLPAAKGRLSLLAGDITKLKVGLADRDYDEVAKKARLVYHLAAIYDLAVSADVAWQINVVGTRNVVDLCRACSKLERLVYFSTCYVAGLRTGRIFEDELEMGQEFKNQYERTKYEAEKLVRANWDKIPTVILRPSIVVGDSHTGETDKYDGPYFPLLLLMRIPRGLPMVYLGAGNVLGNAVPVDFIVNATMVIADKPDAAGKCFALADPNPMLVKDTWDVMLSELGHKPAGPVVPMKVIKFTMRSRRIRQLVRLPLEMLTYFEHPQEFDARNTEAALEGSGVSCPPVREWMPTIIRYAERHPKLEQLRQQIY